MCSIVKEKKSRLVYDGCSVGSLFSYRECVCVRRLRRRCVFRAADGKLATLRTGSTVMRCLGGRNIDPVGPQRTSCATLQRLTTKNPSSKKKTFRYIPNEMHHHRHGGGGDFFTHKRREPLERRPRRIFLPLGFIISLFSVTYVRSKICSW